MNKEELFENILQFIANLLDATYQECDDGYVICCKNTLRLKKEKVIGIDFVFDENGNFEGIKSCK